MLLVGLILPSVAFFAETSKAEDVLRQYLRAA
jgi:hypothetical protein